MQGKQIIFNNVVQNGQLNVAQKTVDAKLENAI